MDTFYDSKRFVAFLVRCYVRAPFQLQSSLSLCFPVELAMIMDRLYGGVCYAGIDTDPELKYPKGAGRVAFSNQQSYIAAISARFVQLQHNDIDKRVSEFTSFLFGEKGVCRRSLQQHAA